MENVHLPLKTNKEKCNESKTTTTRKNYNFSRFHNCHECDKNQNEYIYIYVDVFISYSHPIISHLLRASFYAS